MNAYDFVHLVFYALGGEVKGKTKLQKTVYFVGVMSGCLDELGYRPHFYGPYSDEVTEAVSRLKSLGFLNQTMASGGAYDSQGFEVSRYDYYLNEQGMRIAEEKAGLYPDLWDKIQTSTMILQKIGNIDYLKMSIAAKTYFMLNEKKGKASMPELAELAKRFGWSVTDDQVSEAACFLESVGLVQISS